MLENTDPKKSINLKKIFRHQVDPHHSSINRKASAHLNISSPILQHSTSIYSLVSPTRTAFTSIYSTNSNELPFELYQPVSSPPPIPLQHNLINVPNSVSPAPPRRHFNYQEENDDETDSDDEREQQQNMPTHPLDLPPFPSSPRYDTSSFQHNNITSRKINPSRNVQVRQTVATDPRKHIDAKDTTIYLASRRHSCSSTAIYRHQQGQKGKQPGSSKHNCNDNNNESNNNNNNNNVVTLRKLRERRRSSKVGCLSPTTAASSIENMMETSKSTPHKVKTYNVPKRRAIMTPEEVEKQKKIQELEDLITGRRGSTLKLTLTPKVLS